MYTGVKQNQKAVSSAQVSSSQCRESFVQDAEKYVLDRVGKHRKAQDDDDVGDGSMHKALLFLGVSSGRPVDGVRNRRLKRLRLTQLLLLPSYVRLNFLNNRETSFVSFFINQHTNKNISTHIVISLEILLSIKQCRSFSGQSKSLNQSFYNN